MSCLLTMLRPGIETSHEFDVKGRAVTNAGGAAGPPLLSTTAMIEMVEQTAAMLVCPHLDEGKTTVACEAYMRHIDTAAEGSKCTAHVRLDEIRFGRELRFAVEVSAENGRTIGVGTHERRVIAVKRPPAADAG